jgi:hypothetical protein
VIGLTGDFGKLSSMQSRVGSVSSVPQEVAADVAPQLLADAQASFTRQAGPDGKPWPADQPDTIRRGSESTLRRTGAAAGSLGVKVSGLRVVVSSAADYLKYQRARSPLPTNGLPKSWADMIRADAQRKMRAKTGGGA